MKIMSIKKNLNNILISQNNYIQSILNFIIYFIIIFYKFYIFFKITFDFEIIKQGF